MNPILEAPGVLKRWLVFNTVGLMGIAVQMAVLFALTRNCHLNYLIATAIAVEAAVLHNFFWHERWTWADRVSCQNTGCFLRLLYFHFTNGAFSIAGNIFLMHFLVENFGLSYIPANSLAIAACAILNFVAGDRLVFRSAGSSSKSGDLHMTNKSTRTAICAFALAALSLLLAAPNSEAAELHPDTLKAWQSHVELTERRIGKELSSANGFLALDYQNSSESARERRDLLSGKIPIKQVPADNKDVRVPDGMVHHWRGCVFIPGVTLDFVFSRIVNPTEEDTRQEDVLDSRVLERGPEQLKLYLKLQRSKIVTVVYNTEHLVRYRRHNNGQAYSSSIATKIAELERSQGQPEREKPEGRDSGFLWRMNSYWRYEQVPGGVIVECESMTLSRSIPSFLLYIVRPIINSVARESMHRTLESMRIRMTRSYQSAAGNSES